MDNLEHEDGVEDAQSGKYEPTLGMLFDSHEEIGKSETKSTDVLKPKPIAKTGCDARIGGCVNEDGKWILRTLNLEHNHGLSPDKARYFSSGAYENVSFLEKDCRNLVDKGRRLQLGEGDAMTILKYFQNKQAECNDVITFDTTYLTNKYDMPFDPFVGVNHHGQSILLGCGLISHEDTETFTWLFEAWLSYMSNSPPIGIITDQDKAMQKAITNVFPTTRHRWCLWHIMKKVLEKLRAFKEREGIISSLLSAVYDSLSPNMFDEAWHDMMTVYNLWDNDWLNGLYEEWYRWVPCYLNNCFWVGMSTTQRSEIMNAFFDGFVNAKTNLKQFVKQHALTVLIRNGVEVLPEMYILARWRRDVMRSYSKVKVSYDGQHLTIQQEMYDKMCNAFSEVADIAADDESSYKYVLDWINKALKDLPKQIRCASVETTISPTTGIGEGSCSSNNIEHVINDPVATRRKGRLPSLRKESIIRKKSTQKKKTAERNTDLEEDASLSSQVPNQFSTQQSNVGVVPIYPTQGGVHNIYQPFPYNWQQQPLPPYALQPHYPSHSMTYEGSESGSFQHLLHQQHNEDNNGCD
ncbi:hypothetical protein WN943_018476 [Citrus x changshan-huyou]